MVVLRIVVKLASHLEPFEPVRIVIPQTGPSGVAGAQIFAAQAGQLEGVLISAP